MSNYFVTLQLILYGSRTAVNRTPTFAINLSPATLEKLGTRDPAHLTSELTRSGVHCSHGNHYAVELVDRRLGLEPGVGVTRISLLHYNNMQDIDKVLNIIGDVCN